MKITKGVHTQFTVHVEDFDFDGVEKVVLTMKETLEGSPIVVREFTEAAETLVIITPAEAEKFSGNSGFYDFDAILTNGNRIKISKNGKVEVSRGVGNVRD